LLLNEQVIYLINVVSNHIEGVFPAHSAVIATNILSLLGNPRFSNP